jgi:alkylated DNA nucleotide flippase Atl1
MWMTYRELLPALASHPTRSRKIGAVYQFFGPDYQVSIVRVFETTGQLN